MVVDYGINMDSVIYDHEGCFGIVTCDVVVMLLQCLVCSILGTLLNQ